MKLLLQLITLSMTFSSSVFAQVIEMNSKSMLSGYFFASSLYSSKDLGGYGDSANPPKQLTNQIKESLKNGLSLEIENSTIPFQESYRSHRVRLSNNSDDKVSFSAQDGRLSIIHQAKDRDGEWKAIEYLPRSWCGNSYHTLVLGPGQYWEFIAPRYAGSYATRMRLMLKGIEGNETPLYSEEFSASINREQFTEPIPSHKIGTIDPYQE